MRIWTIHPRYLDAKGLVALWRETLLAQAVLRGQTKGYRNHPQLDRFKEQPDPIAAVARYLEGVAVEATARGYRFDAGKIARRRTAMTVKATRGQVDYEWKHLLAKLRTRDPARFKQHRTLCRPAAHPLFRVVAGGVSGWERRKAAHSPRKEGFQ